MHPRDSPMPPLTEKSGLSEATCQPPSLSHRRRALYAEMRKARARLQSMQDAAGNNFTVMQVLKEAGGHEGLASLIMFARLDRDHSGDIGDEELRDYQESAKMIVDANLNFALNTGVVAALLLSVVYPMSFALQVKEVTFDATPVINALLMLRIIGFGCSHIAVALSFVLLTFSARIYTQISFWMPSLESQIWYTVRESKTALCARGCGALCPLSFAPTPTAGTSRRSARP